MTETTFKPKVSLIKAIGLLTFFHKIRITDVLVVAFTGLLVFYTGRLWYATAGLWRSSEAANKLALDSIVAGRRAWVAIESVKLKHPTAFTDAGAVFGVNVIIKNLGETPATSVEVKVESCLLAGIGAKFGDAKKRFKDTLRRHPVELGYLLFPKDELRHGVTWSEGEEKIKGDVRTLPSGERTIAFIVFVGVSYRIIGDDAPHITYHAHEMLNVPIGTAIPSGALIDLPRMPFLAGEAD